MEGVSRLVCESQLDYGEETAKGKIDLLIPQNNLMQTLFIWNCSQIDDAFSRRGENWFLGGAKKNLRYYSDLSSSKSP